MKKITLAVFMIAFATSAFASAELPRYTRPAFAPFPSKFVTEIKPSFFQRTKTYVINRGNDIVDIGRAVVGVVRPTADCIVGIVGFDPENDDQ
jgi:hypothetical protein